MKKLNSAVNNFAAVALSFVVGVGGLGATTLRAQTWLGLKDSARGARGGATTDGGVATGTQSKGAGRSAASSLPSGGGKATQSAEARARTLARLNKIKGPVVLDKISPDLQDFLAVPGNARKHVRVVCRLNAPPGRGINRIYARPGVSVSYSFANSIDLVASMPASVVLELSAQRELDYILPDREVRTLGHVSATTGADAVRAAVPGRLDGTGVGIAVLDSGIDRSHKVFRMGRTDDSDRRIVLAKSFVGDAGAYATANQDSFGHGTHVASLAAGNGRIANASYVGIAPNANLVNLRVLDDTGRGSVSSVLQALDWLLTNHRAYNIRVVNMSLGMPAIDSYQVDPICIAVRKLVDAGVVVVAAAGNNGKDA
ncbi:MAG: S8 family serine peptidase, partial [Acidobacteria bacterium]|nr:S8 family serine peptidase [Acidobacteriota bacterium]